MKKVNYYFLRHAKTQGLSALNGHSDVLVAPQLQHQLAQCLLSSDMKFEKIITSPLKRCANLADILVDTSLNNLELTVESKWQEMSFGDVDGIAFEDMPSSDWPLLERFWQNPAQNTLPNAESLSVFHQRVNQAWQYYVSTNKQDSLVVTHGGVIRMLVASLLSDDWQNPNWYSILAIENASLTHIQVTYLENGRHLCQVKFIGNVRF